MHLKNPALLYFLFLLIIPILVHLFQLRKFKKEYFTNVKFLKDLAIQTRKSASIKKWLLLSTRILLLTAIIFAFAQPFFSSKDVKNVSNDLFIILDNSASMQAKGQKGELLKRAVEDLLVNVPQTTNFSIITCSNSFFDTDIKTVQKDLQSLNYSSNPFELDVLLAKANVKVSANNKDIVIITDAIGIKENQLKSIKNKNNTFFVVPKSEKKNNSSIDSVYIDQTQNNFYELGIVLSQFGNEEKIPISLINNNKLVAKTEINFDSKQKTINFTIPKSDFHGFVSIIDNSLEYDNKLYFSISKPQKLNVISIGETPKSKFLSKIYTIDEFIYNNYEISTLDYNNLQNQDAIVLNELIDIPQALQTTLKIFVEKGGNLVFIPSKDGKIQNINTFLSNFGTTQFLNTENTEKLITKIAFDNPLFADVFEKKVSNFQYPKTNNSFKLNNNNSSILGNEDQSAFLTSIQNPLSSVYIFTAAINPENSNFQQSPLIVPTFYNMVKNSTKTGISNIILGKNQSVILNQNLTKDEILTLKNDKESSVPIQQLLNNKIKLTFNNNPETAGNYGVFNKQNLVQNLSFNYSRTEGNLEESNINLLSDFKIVNSIETLFDTLKKDRTDSELWKLFVFMSLLFLVAELLIQKFVK